MSKAPHAGKLAELQEGQLKAKQLHRDAEAEAVAARNAVEGAEQRVVEAHAGRGELRAAERAMRKAEDEVKDKNLRARGAALRLEEAQTQVRHYMGSQPGAHRGDRARRAGSCRQAAPRGRRHPRGTRAMWAAQAQVVNDLLNAGGLRAGDNMPHSHQLAEVARTLRSFDGTVTPPLPHYRALHFQQQDEQTKARMRQGSAAA